MLKRISSVLEPKEARKLRAGDEVLISGEVFGARDSVHKRFMNLIDKGLPLPIDLSGRIIYYTGPSFAPEDLKSQKPTALRSAGPTTSGRMDSAAAVLIRKTGLAATLGKGNRNKAVTEAMKECGALYFAAIGGCGALLARSIVEAEIIAYEDLGTEALWRFVFNDFPCIVAIDAHGRSLYEER